MKVTIERSTILKALNHVQSIVERRTTIPILSNVMIVADGGMIALTATDLEIEVREKIVAEVSQAGKTTAPAHMLYDIIRKLPDGAQIEFSLNSENNHLKVQSGKSSFTLQTLSCEDFPILTTDEMPHAFALAPSDLQRLFEKTSFAMSMEETRYYLNGVYLHTIDDTDGKSVLRAVATDGHRLAHVQIPQPVGAVGIPPVIVPRKTVNELLKLLDDVEGEISLQISESKINFAFSNIVITSKLIDGKFPDYNRVIPDGNDKQLSVNIKNFSRSVELVSAVANEKTRAVKLNLKPGMLLFSVFNTERGEASDELDVEYQSEEIEIGFNARYLLEITSRLDGDTAIFELADSGAPTIIRDANNQSALYVLMPMRV